MYDCLREFINIRRKYYFVNYSYEIQISKRIYNILSKKFSKNILTISFKDIIYALRWELGISNKFKLTFKKNSEIVNNSKKVRTPKLSVEAKLQSIAKALSILKNAKLIQINTN